ncbi:MAG: hypothetical protein LBJ13_03260 [Puniceicoccales bacterium]|jgi:hypothetical protein|nr:hypothetical protein [Puniceicoccales bacterium]
MENSNFQDFQEKHFRLAQATMEDDKGLILTCRSLPPSICQPWTKKGNCQDVLWKINFTNLVEFGSFDGSRIVCGKGYIGAEKFAAYTAVESGRL